MVLTKREKLLALHLFFDISIKDWENFEKNPPLWDPFATNAFRLWTQLDRVPVRSLEEAHEHSERISYRRITFLDPEYPFDLDKDRTHLPPVLYQLGAPIPRLQSLVAIVGTRKPSAFGVQNTIEATRYFSQRGIGIVSGLARGIDSIAHAEAIRQDNYTLAVLGCGLDRIYPKENRALWYKILEKGGTMLSQFPPHTVPHPSHFPRRNHIIAGLSAGTIAVEGAPQSGAAITAKAAMDWSRTAVVLTQDFRKDFGKGAIELIRLRATPVCNFPEAYEAIAAPFGGKLEPLPGREDAEQLTTDSLGDEFTLEEFATKYNLPITEAIILLQRLVLAGQITAGPNQTYHFTR